MATMYDVCIHSFDEIESFTDDELYTLTSRYKEIIVNSKNYSNDVKMLEVEVCYFQREIRARERWRKPSRDLRFTRTSRV